MSTRPKLVGPSEFCRETGLTKPVFYTLLKQMKYADVAAKTQKKIDMNCEWMRSYMDRSRRVQTNAERFESEEQSDFEIADETETIESADKVPLTAILYEKELETVNKLKIDNAIKSKRVVSKKIVITLIEKIDDAFNKIIMDGEASLVPQLMQKIKSGCSEEEAKKFWRKEITKVLSPVKPFMQRTIKRFMEDK